MTFTPEIEDSGISKPTPDRKSSRRRWIGVLLLCFIAFGAYLFFTKRLSNPNPEEKKRPAAVSVVAEAATKSDMGFYVIGLGTVTPIQTVTVRSNMDGELMKVHFKEGEFVKDGDLLAAIDPRPFEVQLTQAEGQMARDQALLQNARIDLDRYRVLWEQDSIPKQQLDTQESLVRQYEGAVKVDQGQIDSAKIIRGSKYVPTPKRIWGMQHGPELGIPRVRVWRCIWKIRTSIFLSCTGFSVHYQSHESHEICNSSKYAKS